MGRRTLDGMKARNHPQLLRRAAALLLGWAVLVGAGACRRAPVSLAPSGGAAEAMKVQVRLVEGRTWPKQVIGSGTLHAYEEVMIGAEVAGQILEIGPEVAEAASENALLARVSEVNYALLRDQRARALEESLARLGLATVPGGPVELEKLPAVVSARLEAENAAMRFDRGRQLHARTPPLMSDQEIADLKTAAEVAESRLAAARLDAAGAVAAILTRRSELAVAEEQVRKTRHHSPAAGGPWVVAERRVAAGDYVAPGDPLYRLLDLDPLKLRVRIPERRMEGVVAGQKAEVLVAGRSEPVAGRVLRVHPMVDERTRNSEVEIEVPNPDLRLLPGGFATAAIEVGRDEGVPVVPESAVVVFAGIHKLIVEEKGAAGEKLVTLGRRIGGEVELLSGLRVGEAFVENPPPGLVLGTPLVIMPPATSGAK